MARLVAVSRRADPFCSSIRHSARIYSTQTNIRINGAFSERTFSLTGRPAASTKYRTGCVVHLRSKTHVRFPVHEYEATNMVRAVGGGRRAK